MAERSLQLILIEGPEGIRDVAIKGPLPLHLAELALLAALATVQRELLAVRLGARAAPGGLVVARELPKDGRS